MVSQNPPKLIYHLEALFILIQKLKNGSIKRQVVQKKKNHSLLLRQFL
jgi:hypothetical protein